MVEFGICPVAGVVAASTIATEIAFVYIVVAVARLASVWRISMFGARLVASIAGSIGMLTQQFEVGGCVIKRRFIQHGNFRVPAFMIGMA